MLDKEVEDIKLGNLKFSELVDKLGQGGGFSAKNLSKAVDILEEMKKDDCIKFLSFPACVIATGLRGVIAQMIEKGLVDVIITTCGTLDHDLARLWGPYYHGRFEMDDAKLAREGISRLGNVLVTDEVYGITVEKKMMEFLNKIYESGKKELATYELIWEIGNLLEDVDNKGDSIIYQATKHKVPVIIPGITDGAIGLHLWQFSQDHDFKINVLKDEQLLCDMTFKENQKTGALMIGGGISKHHTMWWNQLSGGMDYAVFITTATQYDGSLSGARLTEAVSWKKIKEKAKYVTVDGDATIILPIILSALYEKV